MTEQDSEDSCMKCFPYMLRPGKKFLFVLVTVNLVILWYFYSKSSDLSHFGFLSKNDAIKATETSLSNLTLFHIPLLSIKNMVPFYSEVNSNVWCFLHGTDLTESKKRQKCICLKQWYGLDCGIPYAVWKSSYLQEGKNGGVEIRRRKNPRRIISSLVVDDQLDLLDINIRDTFSLVDVFLTVEEETLSPSLLEKFERGFLSGFQSKIMPVKIKLTIQPKSEKQWITAMLGQLWTVGWKRLTDFRPDDIFVFSHVSSIISKDVLLFLKLYDGYPEPILFKLRPLLFKFQKEIQSNNTVNNRFVPFIPFGCTFQYITTFCRYDMIKLFTNSCLVNVSQKKSYEETYWKLKEWTIGDEVMPSGWHCNLCCKRDCIKYILSKHKWYFGNSSSSVGLGLKVTNISVIENFLHKKKWLDGSDFTIKDLSASDSFFAPSVVTQDQFKYSYLIDTSLR